MIFSATGKSTGDGAQRSASISCLRRSKVQGADLICLGVNSGDDRQARFVMKTPKHEQRARACQSVRALFNFSGCEAHAPKGEQGVDRHVANRALQRTERRLEMSAASNSTSLRNGGLAKRSNRLIAPRLLGSTHMGSRHCHSLS